MDWRSPPPSPCQPEEGRTGSAVRGGATGGHDDDGEEVDEEEEEGRVKEEEYGRRARVEEGEWAEDS